MIIRVQDCASLSISLSISLAMATSDEFVIDRTLGEGAFGKVFLVTGSGDNKKVGTLFFLRNNLMMVSLPLQT